MAVPLFPIADFGRPRTVLRTVPFEPGRTLRFVLGIMAALFMAGGLTTVLISRSFGRFSEAYSVDNFGTAVRELPLIVADLVAAALTLLALRRLSGQTLGDLGLRPLKTRDFAIVAFAIACVLALSVLGDYVLGAFGIHNHVQSGFENYRARSRIDRVTDLIAACVVAPFDEELFFRGLLLNAFGRWFGTVPAIIASSVLFGAFHVDAVYFVMFAIFGGLNCIVYRVTGNLYAPMLVHAANNAVFTVALLAAS